RRSAAPRARCRLRHGASSVRLVALEREQRGAVLRDGDRHQLDVVVGAGDAAGGHRNAVAGGGRDGGVGGRRRLIGGGLRVLELGARELLRRREAVGLAGRQQTDGEAAEVGDERHRGDADGDERLDEREAGFGTEAGAHGGGTCVAPASLMWPMSWYIGMISDSAMKPTTPPITSVRAGVIMPVRASTRASTSRV